MFMFLSSACISSALATTLLHVVQKTGEEVTFSFNEKPKTTFDGGNIVIATASSTVEYDFNSVKKFTFEEVETPTAIDDITVGKVKAGVSFEPGQVTISGAQAGSTVYVFAINGAAMGNYKVDADGSLAFSTADLPNGIYVIKGSNISVKFIKK